MNTIDAKKNSLLEKTGEEKNSTFESHQQILLKIHLEELKILFELKENHANNKISLFKQRLSSQKNEMSKKNIFSSIKNKFIRLIKKTMNKILFWREL